MKLQTNRPTLTLEKVETELKENVKEFNYYYRNNLAGKHLIIEASSAVGLGVWVKNGEIEIEAIIPSLKIALFLGVGVGLVFLFTRKRRAEMREKVIQVLKKKYHIS